MKRFVVYYFVGDFWTKGEHRKRAIIEATNEYEAEMIFKQTHSNCSFGWVEEY